MNKKIIVSLPSGMIEQQKKQITGRINDTLQSINIEVSAWNGFVDFAQNDSGDYQLIAKCDNDEVREKMQQLLNAGIEVLF